LKSERGSPGTCTMVFQIYRLEGGGGGVGAVEGVGRMGVAMIEQVWPSQSRLFRTGHLVRMSACPD
jgi:hypothetical protein